MMIKLTRTSGEKFILNAEQILEVQETPDTVITLNNGKKLLVKDSADDIVAKVINYRQRVMAGITRTGERS
ncbi:flagellar protein FlbD [Halanaerobium congolense]|jgi:flagellar protein FlbD|uniref:Flagellar protein FlbD n=2 Tax=Halanaerobiaceae TaxID=972 RepID=A0A1G6S442_9FIRM|nr:MAG: flagellar protein FlbD [Halanaerobium sp. T82-1]PUU87851.1 MAG: flagellar protein FlbD [Halanaerobium sp.]TDP26344.1 flagellar protein FlbD [Halanaerobium congolense]PUU92314.1 MAG: flagellar protein FlbD [Halanaerobium sp.]TDS34726.1 flagellar protein FlbD [Halanaerobium congolense]